MLGHLVLRHMKTDVIILNIICDFLIILKFSMADMSVMLSNEISYLSLSETKCVMELSYCMICATQDQFFTKFVLILFFVPCKSPLHDKITVWPNGENSLKLFLFETTEPFESKHVWNVPGIVLCGYTDFKVSSLLSEDTFLSSAKLFALRPIPFIFCM